MKIVENRHFLPKLLEYMINYKDIFMIIYAFQKNFVSIIRFEIFNGRNFCDGIQIIVYCQTGFDLILKIGYAASVVDLDLEPIGSEPFRRTHSRIIGSNLDPNKH